MKTSPFDPTPAYDFRKVDGVWQRREMKNGANWRTLHIEFIGDRRGNHRSKIPKWKWKQEGNQ